MQYQPPLGSTDPNASYVQGSPSAGIRGSFVPAAAVEQTMRELMAIIAADPELTPSNTDLGQAQESIAHQIATAVAAIKLPAAPKVPGAGEGNGIDANGNIAWNIPGLAEEDTIGDGDFFGFYQSAVEGGQPAGDARKVNGAALAAYVLAKASSSALSQGGAPANVAVFSTPGVDQWFVPAGITLIKRVYIWGGGGGGGSSSGEAGSASGGGGGGFALAVNLSVTPNEPITVTVGAGGAGGTNDGDGGVGGTSSFGAFASATGGAPGLNDQENDNVFPNGGGAGGQGYGNYIDLPGSTGGVPFAAGYQGFEPVGGAGGGSPGGGSTTYINTNAAGAAGNFPGGGGAGGAVGLQGGTGASGVVAVEY